MWQPQIEGLKGDHQLAWFDNRGVGESESGESRTWTMADMAFDALRVLDALGWDSAHIVGVSMGGMIAQEIALRAPGRVKSLSLIATHSGGKRGFLPGLNGIRCFLRVQAASTLEQRISALSQLLYTPSFLATVNRDELERRSRAQAGTPTDRKTVFGQLSAVVRHDTRSRLKTLEASTLIVKPEGDILIRPERSEDLHRRIPNSRLVKVPGGHGTIFENADLVNSALREHFRSAEVEALAMQASSIHA